MSTEKKIEDVKSVKEDVKNEQVSKQAVDNEERVDQTQLSPRDQRIEALKKLMSMVNFAENDAEQFITFLGDLGFFDAPASTKYHGAYSGGLFDHSYVVANTLIDLTSKLNLKWQRAESPFIIGICHDLCKVDQYKFIPVYDDSDSQGPSYKIECNSNTLLTGHGEKSIAIASQFFVLTAEEIMCIRYHMGAFGEKEEQPLYSNAVKAFSNVLWTHTADIIASQIYKI